MELGLAVAAFIFALLAFVVSVGTLTYLLVRRFSTVEVRYEAPPAGETIYQFEQPPLVRSDENGNPQIVPRPPVSLTEAEYEKKQRIEQLEAQFTQQAEDIDF